MASSESNGHRSSGWQDGTDSVAVTVDSSSEEPQALSLTRRASLTSELQPQTEADCSQGSLPGRAEGANLLPQETTHGSLPPAAEALLPASASQAAAETEGGLKSGQGGNNPLAAVPVGDPSTGQVGDSLGENGGGESTVSFTE